MPFSPSRRSVVVFLTALAGCGGGAGPEDGATGTAGTGDAGSGDGATGTTAGSSGGTATGASSTSGVSDSSGPGTTGEPTGGDFIDPPDSGVGGNECDPGFQDCRRGQKCTGAPTRRGDCCIDANHCVPDTGDRQFGEACTRLAGDDDCALGLFCMTMFSGTTGPGVCMEYCVPGDPGSCENGGDCVPYTNGLLPLCEIDCDPLAQACANGMGCYWTGTRFVCAAPTPAGIEGAACDVFQSCAPGLTCVEASRVEGCNDPACCTAWCDLTGPDPCTAPETCQSWFKNGPPPGGHESVGACEVPP